MSLPDNRMRFSPAEIDFAADVGLTGQAHDNYPAPNQQPRYDWWRMSIIALLSNQSSDPASPPTQYRIGTLWFNKTEYKYYDGSAFTDLSKAIILRLAPADLGITLSDWYYTATEKLTRIQPRFTFSGHFVAFGTHQIPIPDSIRTALTGIETLMQPIVYLNGLILDPRLCKLSGSCPLFVNIDNSIEINANDKFIVVIERMDIASTEEVLA